VYKAKLTYGLQPLQKTDFYHGSIDLNNDEYHAEEEFGEFGLSSIDSIAVDVGTDSVPQVVYSKDGHIYYLALNPDPSEYRIWYGPIQIDEGGYDLQRPNIVVDRDTIRRHSNVVDWDDPQNNDRATHVVYYRATGIGGTCLSLVYMKLDSGGGTLISPKPIVDEPGFSFDHATDYPDMSIDSDNRVSIVATGHQFHSESWYSSTPEYALYYVKIDNNGELLTSYTQMNTKMPFVDQGAYTGEVTFNNNNSPAIDMNDENEVHMVLCVTAGASNQIHHTRHDYSIN